MPLCALVVAGCGLEHGSSPRAVPDLPPITESQLAGLWQRIDSDGGAHEWWPPENLLDRLVPPNDPPTQCFPCSRSMTIEGGVIKVHTTCSCNCPSPSCGHGQNNPFSESESRISIARFGDLLAFDVGGWVSPHRWETFVPNPSQDGPWHLERFDSGYIDHANIQCANWDEHEWRDTALGGVIYGTEHTPYCGEGFQSIFFSGGPEDDPDFAALRAYRRP